MSGSSPQKGIPQTGIGPNSTGSQAWVAKQGLIASAPWTVLANSALSPSSFRFLLNLIKEINGLQGTVVTLQDEIAALQARLTRANIPP